MRLLIAIPLLTLFLILNGCSTARSLARSSDVEVAGFKASTLNGSYENVLPDDPYHSLWQDLYANEKFKPTSPSSYGSQVELELLNEKTLVAHLVIGGERLETLKIKGRIKNDYFVANRKFFMLPLIFFNYYRDHKTIIGNLPNGDLHLVQSKAESIILFDNNESDSELINADYRRIDTTQVQLLKKKML